MNRFEGQTAIVTGGARGIGLAIAKRLAGEGANIVVADILEEAQEAAAALRESGCTAQAFRLDVRNVGEIKELVAFTVREYGKVDILINNAGVVTRCPALKVQEDAFDREMDINLKGAFFCAQQAALVMRANGGGKIVNISSGNSRMMHVGRPMYCISKAGINAMTAALGSEWAMYNIRVNAIAPGFIRTDMVNEGISLNVLNEKQIMSVSPIGRWGEESEIANLAAYLASDEATYIVGQTFFCDGGWSNGILPNALNYIRENDN